MAIRSRENALGAWAFLIGVVLAIIIGLGTSLISIPALVKYNTVLFGILVILGLIVGFMNVTDKDSQTFLIAGAILVIVSKFGMEGVTGTLVGINVGNIVTHIFSALLTLFVPATIIVALKTVFGIAKI